MSVKKWKQIITIAVVLIIVGLLVATIVLSVSNSEIRNHKETISDLYELATSENFDYDEYKKLVEYFKNVGSGNVKYTELYPELNVDNPSKYEDVNKTVYLTFDDGPDLNVTPKVLDALKKANVKATFFVVHKSGKAYDDLLKRIVDEGHTIAVHAYEHKYTKIYESVEAYLKDFSKMSAHIEKVTGVKPTIFRFPGGSINSYNYQIYEDITNEMIRRGYTYFDWNISSGDATGYFLSTNEYIRNCTKLNGYNEAVILLHDGMGNTDLAKALPKIISKLKSKGYKFDSITQSTPPVYF